MKLRIAENFRAVFYAPFYAVRALGLAKREGLAKRALSAASSARRAGASLRRE